MSSARPGLSADIDHRYRRYALTMGIRTLCFVGAVLTEGAVRGLLFTGALLLPYMAVLAANGGREVARPGLMPIVLPSRTHLPPLAAPSPEH